MNTQPKSEPNEELHKGLSFLHLFCLAAGAMISSGIFILPGLAFSEAGPSVIVSYALAGALALLGILSVAELATAMPKAGGDYYFVNRSLGPMAGTVAGLLSWFALSLKTSFAVFGLSEVVHLLSGWPRLAIAAPICLLFTLLNIVGVKEAARLEVTLVLALLTLMGLYFIMGVGHIEPVRFQPFLPRGFNKMLVTAGFVFVSFGGLLNVATVAEEVTHPKRDIPLAFISSIVVITIAYTLLLFITVGLLPPDQLSGSLTPLADAARTIAGSTGFVVLTVAAVLAFLTTANAGIMAASRYPLALSRDHLISPFIQYVSPRFGTPVVAVGMTGTMVFLSLLMDLELLVKAASTVVLTTYVLAAIAVIVLRQSRLQNYRPTFKVPGYPWVPGLGIFLFSLLIVDMGAATIEISLGMVCLGLGLYVVYGRRHSRQEFALLHLIERLTSRDLAGYSLESELKTILQERDQVIHDHFDETIKQSVLIDLNGAADRDQVFHKLATALKDALPLDETEIYQRLCDREQESSTNLSSFVAVPHIVIPGNNVFHIALVRSKDGIEWNDEAKKIHAVFVICGTKDGRNLHLRALAAIAHIVQHKDFEQQWMTTRRPDQLRDLLLLSERKRQS